VGTAVEEQIRRDARPAAIARFLRTIASAPRRPAAAGG
jgi:hypothetical protein